MEKPDLSGWLTLCEWLFSSCVNSSTGFRIRISWNGMFMITNTIWQQMRFTSCKLKRQSAGFRIRKAVTENTWKRIIHNHLLSQNGTYYLKHSTMTLLIYEDEGGSEKKQESPFSNKPNAHCKGQRSRYSASLIHSDQQCLHPRVGRGVSLRGVMTFDPAQHARRAARMMLI